MPIQSNSVNHDELEKCLELAVTEVFATMLNFKVEIGKAEELLPNGESTVAGAVGFTGDISGIIYLYCSASFARKMTCCLLGMDDKEIEGDDMVNDTMGEMTNMIAGHAKAKLDNGGSHCTMTIPSVVRGADFIIEPVTGVERRSISFHCNGGRVLVEALIKSTTTQEH